MLARHQRSVQINAMKRLKEFYARKGLARCAWLVFFVCGCSTASAEPPDGSAPPNSPPPGSGAPPPTPAPGCLIPDSSGHCVDPPPCSVKCQRRTLPTCLCEPPPPCAAEQRRDDTCECVPRCQGYMRNCDEFNGCMKATSGNGSACNGRKNQSQQDGCWQGPTKC